MKYVYLLILELSSEVKLILNLAYKGFPAPNNENCYIFIIINSFILNGKPTLYM